MTNKSQIIDFLSASNEIEGVTGPEALAFAVQAWDYLALQKNLRIRRILKAHSILMKPFDQGKEPYLKIGGRFRMHNVWVGSELMSQFYNVDLLMAEWLVNHIHPVNALGCKESHIAFEKIHPFADGNGRIGRMIMNWQRIGLNLPLLIIRPGKEQTEYYKWFK